MKKGFTLIELLAVIVILAIIAVIAVPIIINIIQNSKEGSYDRSVENILHSANIFAMSMKISEDLELDKNIYDKVIKEIKGDRPEEGQVYINKKGEVALSLRYGEYCYTKSYGEKTYYKKKTKEECTTPFYYLKKVDASGTPTEDNAFLDGPIIRSSIEKIVTLSTNMVPEDAIGSWDVTADYKGDVNEKVKGKVMAWYKDEDGNGLYEVYIGQEGGVKANPSSISLFATLTEVIELDLSKFDTSNVTSMSNMFAGCKILTDLDLSKFNTSNVTNMYTMFRDCKKLTSLDLSSFDTSKVTTMFQMFNRCNNLTNLDLSSFDTTNVTSMAYMFNGCRNLTNLDLSSFNTSNVTSMYWMFNSCNSLTSLDLSGFNTINVTNMSNMFASCNNLTNLDLRNFNTSNVTSMSGMFNSTTNLTEILVSKDWKIIETNMFDGSGIDHVTIVE